jgi:hypothetical protein
VDRTDARELAFSVRLPWIELTLAGRKRIEFRTWITAHRGPLWSNTL